MAASRGAGARPRHRLDTELKLPAKNHDSNTRHALGERNILQALTSLLNNRGTITPMSTPGPDDGMVWDGVGGADGSG
jgi:hypothetical protein